MQKQNVAPANLRHGIFNLVGGNGLVCAAADNYAFRSVRVHLNYRTSGGNLFFTYERSIDSVFIKNIEQICTVCHSYTAGVINIRTGTRNGY